MAEHSLTWLDVFTDRALTGNQLAVVHDADGVGDETLLAFARETRQSETTFVQSPTVEGADYRNRILMMRGELPFAGHPSLGTAVAVALRRGEREASYVQQTGAGLQPVDVEITGGRRARTSMLQEPATFGPELDPAAVLAAVGAGAGVADPELTPQLVGTGAPQVVVPVRPEALAALRPDFTALRGVLEPHDAVTLYAAACDPSAGRARARAFYAEPAGASEDPATGSAAGPLMAYLNARTGATSLTIEQGIEMGRASELRCGVEGDRVRVGGDAVVVMTGTVVL